LFRGERQPVRINPMQHFAVTRSFQIGTLVSARTPKSCPAKTQCGNWDGAQKSSCPATSPHSCNSGPQTSLDNTGESYRPSRAALVTFVLKGLDKDRGVHAAFTPLHARRAKRSMNIPARRSPTEPKPRKAAVRWPMWGASLRARRVWSQSIGAHGVTRLTRHHWGITTAGKPFDNSRLLV
jgi:hypothetical protein